MQEFCVRKIVTEWLPNCFVNILSVSVACFICFQWLHYDCAMQKYAKKIFFQMSLVYFNDLPFRALVLGLLIIIIGFNINLKQDSKTEA